MLCLALAGGVGGARMAHGLAMVLPPEELMVAVNIGDDFTHLGLRICPDLDTVMYTFSGQADPETGWGIEGETWSAMAALENLGGLGQVYLRCSAIRPEKVAIRPCWRIESGG